MSAVKHADKDAAKPAPKPSAFSAAEKATRQMVERLTEIKNEEEKIRQGGGAKAIEAQHKKGRLTARERIAKLIDPGTEFFELALYAAYEMYEEWGGAPAAGTVTGLAHVAGRRVMIIANDATVKAGAFFPMTAKKVIRAQNIAIENRIPTIYLVDSAGVFLPLQEDVFPDTDDFGRVFRNNAVMSAMRIPQITAIMGMCVAGGAYLPVMCDHILMTEGSGLFLAGPALVQSAIGQKTSAEELGRRANARANQRHRRLSRAGRRRLPAAHPLARRENGPSARRAVRSQARRASRASRRRNLRNFLRRAFAGNTTCARSSPASSTRSEFDEYKRRIRPNPALRLRAHRRLGRRHRRQSEKERHRLRARHRRKAHRIRRRDLHRSPRTKPRASSSTATRISFRWFSCTT